ncbi:hypothetical protein ACHAW5_011373 [Stephanodiscus triporus]|uniref:Hypoxanthine phosphoribosyltransferase n=1 Tax=Stephanodiscus triporus TaxID=2934178 RepID=A0ABD3MQA9_9STRA
MPTKEDVEFPPSMNPDEIDEVLFTKEMIASRVRELGAEISESYRGDDVGGGGLRLPLVVICTLKGAAAFFADLVRSLSCDSQWEFMAFSSYGGGTTSTGAVQTVLDLRVDIAGRDVLVVEDILDTGHTLRYMINMLQARGPKSVRTAVLLHKAERTVAELGLTPEFVGFVIPNEFVVGYGLDYDQKYRSLPWIGVLAPWVYGDADSKIKYSACGGRGKATKQSDD